MLASERPILVHLNGRLVESTSAQVSIFDRGFLFGDGVYEGLRTTSDPQGQPRIIGLRHHIERMRLGLAEARIQGFDPRSLAPLTDALVRANGLTEAFIYWQVTRGTPAGDAGIQRPRVMSQSLTPTVVGFAAAVTPVMRCTEPEVKRAALRPDTRWLRGTLKSISLLGGVLAGYEAFEAGADDAIMHRDGLVTEGTATNVFIFSNGKLVTPSLESAPMLDGVTRRLLVDQDHGIEQRPVNVSELRDAQEIMLVGTKTMVASVTHLDDRPVGDGLPGRRASELLASLREAIARDVSLPASL